jgi:hypothetical protein
VLEQILDLIGDVEIFLAGAGAIVFAVSYAFFFNWRKTPAGRALMYFVISLIALVVRSSLGRSFGAETWWWQPFSVVVFTAVTATIWRLVWVLWRNWRLGHARPLEIETRPRNKKE